MEMNQIETKALFLGVLSAQKPLPFRDVCHEVEGEEAELKPLWDNLREDVPGNRKKLFAMENMPLVERVMHFSRLGDLFLSGLILSGTDIEDLDNEDAADLLDEMEDHVLLMDDWLAQQDEVTDHEAWTKDGEKYCREFLELWSELQPHI